MMKGGPQMVGEGRLLTIGEAARRLGVHQKTLRAWANRGLVRHVKLPSGHRRFVEADIEGLRQAMMVEPESKVAA
jgi:excisionase family DNA binding protein